MAAEGGDDQAAPRRRRFTTSWVGTPQHFAWLETIVRAIIVLNLADAVLTLVWIATETGREANPLLADLAHQHPAAFVAVKMSLVSLGTLLLWRLRRQPLAVVAIFVAFLTYYFLLLYHLDALQPRLMARVGRWWAAWS